MMRITAMPCPFPAPKDASAAMRRKVLLAAVVGNAFEWFDFTVYGLFAPILARLFFPAGNEVAALMLTLATFGVTFAVRPLSGVLLGLYADRVGRKKAFSFSLALMAASTGAIGLLPTYAAVGVAAPVLLVLARLTQGVSLGGEFGCATAMLAEFAPPKWRGLYTSLQYGSQAVAIATGAMLGWLLMGNLSDENLLAWGWRLPFLLGILIGPVGWWLRMRVDESPEFSAWMEAASNRQRYRPLRVVRWRSVFASASIIAPCTAAGYTFSVYLPILAQQRFGIPAADAKFSLLVSALISVVGCPLVGWLSDVRGRLSVLLAGMVIYAVTAWLLFHEFVAAPSPATLLGLQAGVGVGMSLMLGATPAVLSEAFPVGARSTGLSLASNLAAMTFGGMAPFINTWLVQFTGNVAAPLHYLMASVAVGLVGVAMLRGADAAAANRSHGLQY